MTDKRRRKRAAGKGPEEEGEEMEARKKYCGNGMGEVGGGRLNDKYTMLSNHLTIGDDAVPLLHSLVTSEGSHETRPPTAPIINR